MSTRKKKIERTYSHYSKDASALLGKLIQRARKERKMTQMDLADRAGIARSTLQKIEDDNLSCELGLVFEVATIVGIKLFDTESRFMPAQLERADDKLALLPKTVRKVKKDVDDDF